MFDWLSRLTHGRESITEIQLDGSPIQVICTASADTALKQRNHALIAEAELIFACIAQKQVRFHDQMDAHSGHSRIVQVHEKLILQLTTVMPASCAMPDTTPVRPLPTGRNFTPRWIRIDYVNNHWQGEYGLSTR